MLTKKRYKSNAADEILSTFVKTCNLFFNQKPKRHYINHPYIVQDKFYYREILFVRWLSKANFLTHAVCFLAAGLCWAISVKAFIAVSICSPVLNAPMENLTPP